VGGEVEDATVRRIVESSFDFSLTLSGGDVVEHFTMGPDFPQAIPESWTGTPFIEALTSHTRPKAEALLDRARSRGSSRARQLNLSFPGNVELPVEISAVKIGGSRDVLLLGRSLQHLAEMQQRLVRAQQDMEREYWQYRNAETRYKTLLTLVSDPVLAIDWASLEVLEANEAAAERLGGLPEELVGRDAPSLLSPGSPEAVKAAFDLYRAGETGGRLQVESEGGPHEIQLRSIETGSRRAMLARLVAPEGAGALRPSDDRMRPRELAAVLGALPDGLVVLDEDGSLRWANAAFLELVQLEPASLSEGPPLARWLQGPGSGAAVLLSTLGDRDSVRLYRSALTGELGLETDVEISGAHLEIGGWVLAFRAVGPRMRGTVADSASLGTRVSELSGLLGSVGLKELVGSVAELVERHLISAALEATGGNRTAAAELLMLSRQTLYTKLRDLDLEGDSD